MASELKAAVLLCADGDHAAELAPWSIDEDVQMHVVPGLCRRPEEIGRWLTGSDIGRLVLGLCPEEYSLAEVQTAARKAGFDALGVAIVHLRGASAENAKMLLAAAVARARAYGGCKPENAKLYRPARLSRRSLFKLAALYEYRAVPAIDRSRCAADIGCALCVRACPRAALEWSSGTVSYDKAKCEPCGVCVTACPREAVEYPTCTPAQIEAQIGALLSARRGGPRGILFACERLPDPRADDGWLPITIPCLGMASPAWFLAPLLMGADAVGVAACRSKCPFGKDEEVEGGVALCREFLRAVGAPERLVSRPPLEVIPFESGKWPLLEHPFRRAATANVFIAVARAQNGDEVVLEHRSSPLGIVEVEAGVCVGCGVCARACPTGALRREEQDDRITLTFDAMTCVACGRCVLHCPEAERHAIRVVKAIDLRRLGQGRTVIYEEETLRCLTCGAAIASLQMVRQVERFLGDQCSAANRVIARYCPACRGGLAALAR